MGMFQRVRRWFDGNGAAGPVPGLQETGPAARPVALEIHASVATNTGCVRTENQDAAVFSRPPGDRALATHGVIALVADGMGGCQGGEVASALACAKIPEHYFASADPIPTADGTTTRFRHCRLARDCRERENSAARSRRPPSRREIQLKAAR